MSLQLDCSKIIKPVIKHQNLKFHIKEVPFKFKGLYLPPPLKRTIFLQLYMHSLTLAGLC